MWAQHFVFRGLVWNEEYSDQLLKFTKKKKWGIFEPVSSKFPKIHQAYMVWKRNRSFQFHESNFDFVFPPYKPGVFLLFLRRQVQKYLISSRFNYMDQNLHLEEIMYFWTCLLKIPTKTPGLYGAKTKSKLDPWNWKLRFRFRTI